MENFTTKLQIGNLEGRENWATWRYKISIMLRGVEGAMEAAEGTLIEPVAPARGAGDAEVGNYNLAMAKYRKTECSALLIITTNISEETLKKVMRFNDESANEEFVDADEQLEVVEPALLNETPRYNLRDRANLSRPEKFKDYVCFVDTLVCPETYKEAVMNNEIEVERIGTEEQVADIMTKALPKPRFQILRSALI